MILDHFRLDGQVALVSGGSTGLGQAVAVALAEAGADLALLYASRPEEARRAILGLKRRCMGVQLDVFGASVTQLQGAVQQVTSQLGRLDIIVNCTATTPRPAALEYSEGDWDGMQVDLKAAFFISQAAAQHFRTTRRGKVINIGPLPAEGELPFSAANAPTRQTLLGLTRQLANEWAPLGINVNCIVPGVVDLEAEPGAGRRALAEVPSGRWGAREDIQAAALYLASSASDYLHGQVLYVDGGWSVR